MKRRKTWDQERILNIAFYVSKIDKRMGYWFSNILGNSLRASAETATGNFPGLTSSKGLLQIAYKLLICI